MKKSSITLQKGLMKMYLNLELTLQTRYISLNFIRRMTLTLREVLDLDLFINVYFYRMTENIHSLQKVSSQAV